MRSNVVAAAVRDLIRRRWPDLILGAAVIVGFIWIAVFAVNEAGSCYSGISGGANALTIESDSLKPGTSYDAELCLDGECRQTPVFADDSRDRSSDATSPTTAPPSPGVIHFGLSDWDLRESSDVTVRIYDRDSGSTVLEYDDRLIFLLGFSQDPCNPMPCWSAQLYL